MEVILKDNQKYMQENRLILLTSYRFYPPAKALMGYRKKKILIL